MSPKLKAILQALFVTFLWSTSWVLIKFGLDDIPPLLFAGMRYTFASVLLMLFTLRSSQHQLTAVRDLPRRDWVNLGLLGVVYYTITQGTVFLSLQYLPAVTFSMLLNFSAVVVAVIGILWLREYPNRWQWLGIVIFLAGVVIYFATEANFDVRLIGLVIGGVCVLSNAVGSVIGRDVNRGQHIPPLVVTTVSMSIGSVLLLGIALVVEGLPTLSALDMLNITWLAVVNTAFAFTLWNGALQTLSAVESSIINNTMLIQIAILALIFLGERISAVEFVGLVVAAVGIFMVNAAKTRRKASA